MHRYGFGIATAYTLLGQAVAQLATRTVGGGFHNAQPAPTDWELRRRQLDGDISSGTISITIAPDETCGFDAGGNPYWTCPNNRRCSWESGRLNLIFCGWQALATSCIDSTSVYNTDLCDDACFSNTRHIFCTQSAYPSCVDIAIGGDITTWGCNTAFTTYSLDTTQSLEDREFSTLILVDGTPITTYISSLATAESGTTKSTDTAIDSGTTAISSTTTSTHSSGGGTNVGAIVGGVVGGLAVIGLIVIGVLLILHLRRRKRNEITPPPNSGLAPQAQPESTMQNTHNFVASPTQPEYGANLNSPVKSQGQGFPPPSSVSPHAPQQPMYSPPLHQVPHPGAVHTFELDGDRTSHHHGSIQELH
ncbi:hypothetical protein BGZ61DRAFT_534290 [Ilyonectria robusta]|uniref:uncharacterized protein n=1 Tax=Ilyonectria robusta TaxID=1079257 RepID=UPI001E8E6261|nr:uncharacterized protein BGZ61DRAFT_534290 [Ilyonectria robusta]KAH8685104.1 hypothetical protein BGZ61DRAFT_534290 [Ilyonectria robusta]